MITINKEELNKQMADLVKKFQNIHFENLPKTELGVAVEKAAIVVEGSAKKNLTMNKSVDTGLLRGSMTHRAEENNNGVSAEIGTNVEYAPYVELGTSKQNPKPYLLPALNNNKGKIIQILSNAIIKLINKAVK